MSLLENVRDEVAAAISTLLPDETIAIDWVPVVEREKLVGRSIYVSPDTRETKLVSRGTRSTTVTVLVAVLDPFKQSQEAGQTSSGHDLIDTIIDTLLGHRLASCICTEAEHLVTTSAEHWREYRQFGSFVKLTMAV